MYENHFGLKKNPFSMTPDPNALFLTEGHREALAGLSYAVMRRKGFVVLVGEAGTGKTTLLRKFLEMTPETEAQTSVVLNPTLTAAEFLELLLVNFGLKDLPASKAARLVQLERLLRNAHADGTAPVLVVDEAHRLPDEVLEEIRLLTNFETSDQKLLQIILAGQPELTEVLRKPELRQLKQRVAIRLKVQPLSGKQVFDYLRHRWVKVGGGGLLPFRPEAVSLIALCSNGIPRLINSICDNALLLVFSQGETSVEAGHILEVVRDLDLEAELDSAVAERPEEQESIAAHVASQSADIGNSETHRSLARPEPLERATERDAAPVEVSESQAAEAWSQGPAIESALEAEIDREPLRAVAAPAATVAAEGGGVVIDIQAPSEGREAGSSLRWFERYSGDSRRIGNSIRSFFTGRRTDRI